MTLCTERRGRGVAMSMIGPRHNEWRQGTDALCVGATIQYTGAVSVAWPCLALLEQGKREHSGPALPRLISQNTRSCLLSFCSRVCVWYLILSFTLDSATTLRRHEFSSLLLLRFSPFSFSSASSSSFFASHSSLSSQRAYIVHHTHFQPPQPILHNHLIHLAAVHHGQDNRVRCRVLPCPCIQQKGGDPVVRCLVQVCEYHSSPLTLWSTTSTNQKPWALLHKCTDAQMHHAFFHNTLTFLPCWLKQHLPTDFSVLS